MNAREYILSKQIEWAYNNGIELIGGQGDRGRRAYTRKLENNLFEPLLPETEDAFRRGDGGELAGYPPKMQAVHSSSALAVNVFQFWYRVGEVSQIAHACGLCRKTTRVSQSIGFEVKYPVDDKFRYHQNIDVVIRNAASSKYRVFAIESKFTEAYGGRGHSGLKEKYLGLEVWDGIPNLRKLATSISPQDNHFQYLYAAQLVKHILGLKRAYGHTGFRLLYLWYDAPGSEGARHREEIGEFLKTTRADEIAVHAMSYQELIVRLAREYRGVHKEYIEYITGRYL